MTAQVDEEKLGAVANHSPTEFNNSNNYRNNAKCEQAAASLSAVFIKEPETFEKRIAERTTGTLGYGSALYQQRI